MNRIPCIIIAGVAGGIFGHCINSPIVGGITAFLLFFLVRVLTGAYKGGRMANDKW